jgi:hypothetical protein
MTDDDKPKSLPPSTPDPHIDAWMEWMFGRTNTLPQSFTHWTVQGTFAADPEVIAGTRVARLRFGETVIGDVIHLAALTSLARDPGKRKEFNLPDAPSDLIEWNGLR